MNEKDSSSALRAIKDKIENPILKNLAEQMILESEALLLEKKSTNAFSLKIETELPSGEIYLETLSIMSQGIQTLYSNIFNFLSGHKNEKGPLAKKIIYDSKLILKEAHPGSYDMQVIPSNLNLLIDTALVLEDFIKKSIEDNNYKSLIEKYGVRTFKAYDKWISSINSNQTTFSFKSPKSERIFFTKELLLEIQRKIENTVLIVESKKFEVCGTLSKIDTDSKTLRIDSDTDKIPANVHESTPMTGLVSKLVQYNLSGIKEISYYPHSENKITTIVINNIKKID